MLSPYPHTMFKGANKYLPPPPPLGLIATEMNRYAWTFDQTVFGIIFLTSLRRTSVASVCNYNVASLPLADKIIVANLLIPFFSQQMQLAGGADYNSDEHVASGLQNAEQEQHTSAVDMNARTSCQYQTRRLTRLSCLLVLWF